MKLPIAGEVVIGAAGGLLAFVVAAYIIVDVYTSIRVVLTADQIGHQQHRDTLRCGGTIIPSTLLPGRSGGRAALKQLTYTAKSGDPACGAAPNGGKGSDDW